MGYMKNLIKRCSDICGNPNGGGKVKSNYLRVERPSLKESRSDLNMDKPL